MAKTPGKIQLAKNFTLKECDLIYNGKSTKINNEYLSVLLSDCTIFIDDDRDISKDRFEKIITINKKTIKIETPNTIDERVAKAEAIAPPNSNNDDDGDADCDFAA